MADGAHDDNHPGKRRPDQAIYRPGMFKRGIDLTQTQPRPENHPPPSERRLQQQLRRQQEREREEEKGQTTGGGGQPYYQNQRNNSQYRSLPPTARERPSYRDNVSQSNGYPGRTFNRGRGGGGRGGGSGYRPRDNNFDTQSVRSGRKQNFRPNKNKFPSDTQSEMGGGNNDDDTHSIASTNFSTDTTVYNNGFASELNSRNPSIQSLLSQDIQSFDWADLMADEEERAASQLAKLPETDSNGNQEDDLSSERTGASTPRKLSVDQQSTIDRNATSTQRPQLSSTNDEKIPPVEEEEEIQDLTKKIEHLETKENENYIKPSTSNEEEPTTPIATTEKQPFAEVNNRQETELKYSNEKIIIKPSYIEIDDDTESTSLRHSIQKSINCLNQSTEKLQGVFRQSILPEITEAEMVSYLKDSSECFNDSVNKIILLKTNYPSSNDDFKKCALDAMKVRLSAEKAVQLLAVRKHNYVLTFVTDITMKALFVVSALIVYDLEQAKKYQLIEAFEAIWQKLISRVKMQITSFGKTIVMQLITLIRSSIVTVTEQLEFEKHIGELIRATINTNFSDFTQGILISSPTVVTDVPQNILTFAGNTFRWHGDLARYQSMILGSSDYNPSLKFYFLSFVLDPQNGTALNQMGAVASYKERLAFVQHFLELSKKAFTGEEDDLQLIVDKVIETLTDIFNANNEMNVFTSADFIYQTGILWSLIRMDRVKAEQKDYLKQMLVKYIELLGGSLLNTQEINNDDEKALHSKIAFITSSLALMTHLWPHIGGGKLPGISFIHDFEKLYPQIESPSNIILPEFLLIFHGDPEFTDSNFLTPHSSFVESTNAATVIRLNIIKNFFRKYSSNN
uniref:Uncharacterized protein n=1 Tax=Panagrolaimus sp. ES5 TaxID=591445 RepID=A0AC34FP01_9BILA